MNGFTRMAKTFYIGDVLTNDMVTKYKEPYAKIGQEWKFWAYFSQAFAREVKGNIFVVLPRGRPLNKPYANGDGSNFWSLELPELSRSSVVQRITRLDKDGSGNIVSGSSHVIWNAPWKNIYDPYGVIGDPNVKPTQPTGADIFEPSDKSG